MCIYKQQCISLHNWVGSIPRVDGTPVYGCHYLDIVVHVCKTIAFVNFQWLKKYLLS